MTATKAVHCPAALGPTAVVHVTHPGYLCILQGTKHPPHTHTHRGYGLKSIWKAFLVHFVVHLSAQKLFYDYYCCYTTVWIIFTIISIHFLHQELRLLSSGKELTLATCLFVLTALLFHCKDQNLRQKGQNICTKWYFKSVKKLAINENFLTIDGELLKNIFIVTVADVTWTDV